MTSSAVGKAPASDSRERIIDVAEDLFSRSGYGGTALADVAQGAGLSKASLFHHFASKAQLYCAVMERILTNLETQLTRALARGGRPTERLDRWIDTVLDVLAANPSHPGLLLRVLVDDAELPAGLPEGKAANDAMRRIGATAVALLREGMDAGELRRASAAHTLQTLIGATVHPLATGRFGEELLGRPVLAPSEVRRRKTEVKALLRDGLHAPRTPHAPRAPHAQRTKEGKR
ncbi:MAG: TetR/AcrR family transcriptional regulator [Actinomycetota bacterium]